ncbi:unnamed protein product [Cylindrotheca closterium]|uniref:DUF6824 domain-containing protein n=1 Tax=Cylindrotheca closterium TaxID=2856 RepID=A0AAD2G5Y0_9STRA|nr:unnamed protein product [Cylindrotheca closterium]
MREQKPKYQQYLFRNVNWHDKCSPVSQTMRIPTIAQLQNYQPSAIEYRNIFFHRHTSPMMATSRGGSNPMDTIIAQDLNQLSFQERCAVYEEIHGVDSPRLEEETEQAVNTKLTALQDEIERIAIKPAYDQAMQMSNVYVTSRKFLLMFLRAESMDPAKAANRLVKFMERKLEYFGPESLARAICSSDLDSDDLNNLKTGVLQVLPEKDRSGRAVIGMFLKLISSLPYRHPASMVKIMTFLYLSMIENDDEAQKKGTVMILYFIGDGPFDWDHGFQQSGGTTIPEWLPGKFKCIHLCTPPNLANSIGHAIANQLHPSLRVRFRVQSCESQTECHRKLMTFGLPVHVIPVTTGMKLKTGTHLRWMAKQNTRDASILQTGNFPGIDLPGSHDILLGRGKTLQEHLGNQIMRSLVREWLFRYTEADRIMKTNIAWELVTRIKQGGSRFLARSDDGWWAEVIDDLAREKVSENAEIL